MKPEGKHLTEMDRLLLEAAPMLNRVGGLCSSIQSMTHRIDGRVPTSRRTLMIAQCEGRDYFKELSARRSAHVEELLEVGEAIIEMGLKFKRLPEVKAWANGDFTSLIARPNSMHKRTAKREASLYPPSVAAVEVAS